MLSKNTTIVLETAMADAQVADEISARLISATPANQAQAQAVLRILKPTKKMAKAIAERLYSALAGDHDGEAGREMAKKINGMVDVLKAKANGASSPAVAATFTGQVAGMTTNVTINAVTPGTAGNVTLVADSVKSINTLISDWNTAHPTNTLTLASGNGAQVPTANITLAGGSNASDSDLAPAKAAMGSEKMSKKTKELLVVAMADQKSADEVEAAYNAMIAAVQAITA